MKKQSLYKPIVLIILDGWGISANWTHNCISLAKPRHFDYFWRNFPHLVIQSFSKIAPRSGNMPNSEIGHVLLGTGRVVYPISRFISNQIQSGEFFQNQILNKIVNNAFNQKSNIHLIGLISDSGVFSELEHLYAMLVFLKNKGLKNIYIHGILDGVDIEPNSGISLVNQVNNKILELQIGSINTLVGRNWVFDKETSNTNLNAFISALVSVSAPLANSNIEAIKSSYVKKILDSRLFPIIIGDRDPNFSRIQKNDQIIIFNFLGDNLKNFITTIYPHCKNIYSLTNYNNSKTIPIYQETKIENPLSKILSQNGMKQLKITESCKEKNINYYFNGYEKKPYPQEKKKIISSEKLDNIEEFPQMKLNDLTEEAIAEINNDYDFILINLPNIDILAHTGNATACEEAIAYVDEALSSIVQAVYQKQGCTIITSDHGIAEEINKSKSHSLNPVPFVMINPDNKLEKSHEISQIVDSGSVISQIVKSEKTLADVAPTILDLMGIQKPIEMTGKSLLPILSKTQKLV